MALSRKIAAGAASVIAAGVLSAGLAGCSGSVKVGTSVGTPSASASTLQTALAQKLADAGRPTTSVSCKGDLAGEVGKTATCEVEYADGTKGRAVLTTNAIDGDSVNFDYSVTPVATKEQVAEVVMQQLGAHGQPVDTVECAEDVLAKAGSVVECTVVAGGQSSPYEVTVTSLDGGTAHFNIQPKS